MLPTDFAHNLPGCGNFSTCGTVNNNPGVWAKSTTLSAVPEPASVSLFATMLLGLAFVALKRARQGNPTATQERR